MQVGSSYGIYGGLSGIRYDKDREMENRFKSQDTSVQHGSFLYLDLHSLVCFFPYVSVLCLVILC